LAGRRSVCGCRPSLQPIGCTSAVCDMNSAAAAAVCGLWSYTNVYAFALPMPLPFAFHVVVGLYFVHLTILEILRHRHRHRRQFHLKHSEQRCGTKSLKHNESFIKLNVICMTMDTGGYCVTRCACSPPQAYLIILLGDRVICL